MDRDLGRRERTVQLRIDRPVGAPSPVISYLARAPSATPAGSPSASAANEADDQQQDQRADGGVDDSRNEARAKMDAELRKQPTTDECADDPNDDIADDPEPGASHDLAGQPSCNEADHQYDKETFARHMHLPMLQVQRPAGLAPFRPRANGIPISADGLGMRQADVQLLEQKRRVRVARLMITPCWR
jgi:hypothetical protein